MLDVPAMHRKPRVAVLIDAENVSGRLVGKAMSVAQESGRVVLKRAYGTMSLLQSGSWNTVLKPWGIEPVACVGYVAGKNSSAIRLVVDAMKVLSEQSADVFVIVSGDSDFIPLVREIRAAGRYAYGVGSPCSPEAYRLACDGFYMAEARAGLSRGSPEGGSARRGRNGAVIDETVLEATVESMRTLEPEGGWCDVSRLCNQIRKRIPDFTPKRYGCSNMTSFAREVGVLEVRKVKKGRRVRLSKDARP